MQIRDRHAADGPALERMAMTTHRADGYPKYLPEDLLSFIVDPEALGAWVAVDGEALLGHVALHRRSVPQVMEVAASATGLGEDRLAVVARLLVDPGGRRRGVGRVLLERATDEAVRLGRRAVLDVVDEHRAAVALYEAAGWVRVGQVDWSLPGAGPLREFVYVSPPAGCAGRGRGSDLAK